MEDNYFLDDTNLSFNKNVKRMLEQHGCEGYGLLMYLLEIFAKNGNILSIGGINDLIYAMSYDVWAYNPDMMKSIIYDYGIFEIEDDFWFSCKLLNDKTV